MPNYTLDTLKHIVSFLDWTCDFETLACVSKILKLKSGEKQQILAYWKSKTKFQIFVSDNIICKKYHVNGKIHRLDGPAIESKYRKEWWKNNQLHRTDGPAIETTWGHKEYWVKGERHRSGRLIASV